MSNTIQVEGLDLSSAEPGTLVTLDDTVYEYQFSREGRTYLAPVESNKVYVMDEPLNKSPPPIPPPKKKRKYVRKINKDSGRPVPTKSNVHHYTEQEDLDIISNWLIDKPKLGSDTEKWKQLRDKINPELDYISVKRRLERIVTERKSSNSTSEKKSGEDEDARTSYEITLDDVIPIWDEVHNKKPEETKEQVEDIRSSAMSTGSPRVSKAKTTKLDILSLMSKREEREDVKQKALMVQENKRLEQKDRELDQRDKELELEKIKVMIEKDRCENKAKLDEKKLEEKTLFIQLLQTLLTKKVVKSLPFLGDTSQYREFLMNLLKLIYLPSFEGRLDPMKLLFFG